MDRRNGFSLDHAPPAWSLEMIVTRLVQLGFFVAVVLLWHLVTAGKLISPLFLPSLSSIWTAGSAIFVSGSFIEDFATTLWTFVIAYALAATAGIGSGYVVSAASFLTRVYEPLLAGFFAVPTIVFFPLFILFFGTGIESKVALGAAYGFFPVALNTIAGLAYVDKKLRLAAESMGATRFQVLRRVLLPAAFPIIFTGLRISFIVTFAAIISGEMIAADHGLGYEIGHNSELMETSKMFAYVLLVIMIAFLFNTGLTTLERRRRGALA